MSQSITTSVAQPLPTSEKPSLPVDQLASLDDTNKAVPQSDQQTIDKPSISDSTFPQDQTVTRTDKEPSQFVALDQLKSSEPRQVLSEESAEVALMMGMESNDVIVGERLLKVIQTANFPLKVVSIIKKLTKNYWQSHKTEAPDGMDKMKTFCFGNVMIAAFEIKQLAEEQLKNEKEIEVFRMNEEQLYCLGVKIVNLISIRCKTDSNKEQEEWSMLLQCLEREDAAINRRMMVSSTQTTQQQENNIFNQVSPSKTTEQQPANALEVTANQETNKEEAEENYNSANNNNLSIQTEGHVTDLDISLPVLPNAEEKEPVATKDVKTVTEVEVVKPSE